MAPIIGMTIRAETTRFDGVCCALRSAVTGFKPPTLAQLFQNFPSFNFFGNPNLKPETSIGYDLDRVDAVDEA
jgi:hypothetical protein